MDAVENDAEGMSQLSRTNHSTQKDMKKKQKENIQQISDQRFVAVAKPHLIGQSAGPFFSERFWSSSA